MCSASLRGQPRPLFTRRRRTRHDFGRASGTRCGHRTQNPRSRRPARDRNLHPRRLGPRGGRDGHVPSRGDPRPRCSPSSTLTLATRSCRCWRRKYSDLAYARAAPSSTRPAMFPAAAAGFGGPPDLGRRNEGYTAVARAEPVGTWADVRWPRPAVGANEACQLSVRHLIETGAKPDLEENHEAGRANSRRLTQRLHRLTRR
jgi:hypothetical protein